MSSKMAQFEQTALSLFFFVCMSCFFVMCVFPQSKECLHLGGLVPCAAEYPTQQQETASAIRLSVGATPPTSEQFARRSPPCCGRRIPLSASQSRTQLRNCELWRNNTAFGKAAPMATHCELTAHNYLRWQRTVNLQLTTLSELSTSCRGTL